MDQVDCAGEADDLTREAEKKIRKVLHDLEEATGREIYYVSVDTRNFTRLTTSIILK